MKKVFLFFALIMGFFITSCASNCDCTNCGTPDCCSKCETEQVEPAQDSTETVSDTVVVNESL